jgi:hypothetical protein
MRIINFKCDFISLRMARASLNRSHFEIVVLTNKKGLEQSNPIVWVVDESDAPISKRHRVRMSECPRQINTKIDPYL